MYDSNMSIILSRAEKGKKGFLWNPPLNSESPLNSKQQLKTYVTDVSVSAGRVLVTVYDEAGRVVVIKLVYVMLEAGAVV